MYEEEDKAIDDDELDDIMEEDHEEESDDSDNRGKKKKKVNRDHDETPMEREVRHAQKEELKNLKTQMLTMKDQIAKKANKIEGIKTTLKHSQLVLMQMSQGQSGFGMAEESEDLQLAQQKSFIGGVPTDNIIEVLDEEEEIIENKLREINEATDPEKEILNVDTDEETVQAAQEDDDIDDDEEDDDFFEDPMENGVNDQSDPQIIKLKDRIKFFRHRCVASLGNNLYEKAYDYLKEVNSEGAQAEEKREGLIQILGEDWIGFWAILDQILFYEGMVDELSTLNQSGGSYTEDDEIGNRRGADEALETKQSR